MILIYVIAIILFILVLWNWLNNQFKSLRNLLGELIKGNYSFELKSKKTDFVLISFMPLIKELKKKLLTNNFEVQVASSQIDSASHQISANLSESNAFAQQLYAQAHHTAQNNESSQVKLDIVLNSVKTLIQRLANVKHTSAQMISTSNESEQIIGKGLQEIMEIVQIINKINNSSQALITDIEEFKQTFHDITNILQAVDEIANQTNLLSLNAAIESARAGEHGRGFGVVAEEIRKLSDHSKTAVSQIVELISKMNIEVKHVTNTLNSNRSDVNMSVTLSENVEKSLYQIKDSYNKVQVLIQSVIDITDEEYRNASNIGIQVDDVESTVKQVNIGFKEIYIAIQKQSESINNINSLTDNLFESQDGLSKLVESNQYILEANTESLNQTAEEAIKAIKKEILNTQQLNMEFATVKSIMYNFLLKYTYVEAIWVNDKQGKFIYSNPPAKIANADIREWFQRSIQGDEYISNIYVSAITKNPCLTVSLPIKDMSGEYIGVIGADLGLQLFI